MKETDNLPNTSDIEILAKGATVSFAGKLGGRAIFAFSQIVLARMLGPELFGLYALGWAALRLIGTIAPLGLPGGVIRFGSRYLGQDKGQLKDVISKSVLPSILSGILSGLLLFLLAPWLETVFDSAGLASVLRGFALAVPMLVVMSVVLAVTRIWKRMEYSVIAEDLGQPTINLLIVVVIFLLGGGLMAVIHANTASWAVAMVLAFIFAWRLFPDFFSVSRKKAVSYSELLLFSLPAAAAGTFTFLTSWMDRILLGLFATTADVGIYQALAQPALIITIILRSLNSIFTPMIADLYHKGEIERLKELFKVSTKWGIYLSMPVFLLTCFASREIMIALFGMQYVSGALPLVILTIGQMVNVSSGAVGFVLVMTGHERIWLIASGSSFIINILFNVVLISRFGLVGAAISTMIAVSVLYVGGLIAVYRLVGLWPYDSRYKKGVVAAVLTTLALILLQFLPLENVWLVIAANALVSVGVFAGTLWLLGLDPEDREFLGLLFKKLRGKRARS